MPKQKQAKVNRTYNLPPRIIEALENEASQERRTISNMLEVILAERYLSANGLDVPKS